MKRRRRNERRKEGEKKKEGESKKGRKKRNERRKHLETKVESESVSCSVGSDSLQPPLTVARQAPLSMEFSRQEYWSGLSFPSLGDLSHPGIEPRCRTQVSSIVG